MPQGARVNSGNSLDAAPFKLRLPNPATLAHKILQYGKGCLLYKVDLSRAYRQLMTDPLDSWEDSLGGPVLPGHFHPFRPLTRHLSLPKDYGSCLIHRQRGKKGQTLPPTSTTPLGQPCQTLPGRTTSTSWISWPSSAWPQPKTSAKAPLPSSFGLAWFSTPLSSPWPSTHLKWMRQDSSASNC